jgi:serine protease Do
VPTFPLKMLDDCSPASRAKVGRAIAEAIEVGAPIYNEGKLDACARVYMGTALELQQVQGCQQVKRVLDQAASRARGSSDPATRAWMMRDVFDGVVDVIVRKAKAASDEI